MPDWYELWCSVKGVMRSATCTNSNFFNLFNCCLKTLDELHNFQSHNSRKDSADSKLHNLSGKGNEDTDSIDFITKQSQENTFAVKLAAQEAKEDP